MRLCASPCLGRPKPILAPASLKAPRRRDRQTGRKMGAEKSPLRVRMVRLADARNLPILIIRSSDHPIIRPSASPLILGTSRRSGWAPHRRFEPRSRDDCSNQRVDPIGPPTPCWGEAAAASSAQHRGRRFPKADGRQRFPHPIRWAGRFWRTRIATRLAPTNPAETGCAHASYRPILSSLLVPAPPGWG